MSGRELFVFCGLVLSIALIMSWITLQTNPDVHPDEAWYGNLAYNWIETGSAWTTIDVGAFPDGRGQGTTTLGAVPSRIAIQVWGLSFRSLRLMSFLGGLGVLASVAVVGAQFWTGRAGVMAATLLALMSLFLAGSHINRPEIWLALTVLLALSASIRGWQHEAPLWDIVAAGIAVVSVEIHQNGTVFALALAATYPVRYGRDVWRSRNALGFAGVAGIGGALYLGRQFNWSFLSGQAGAEMLVGTAGSHNVPIVAENPTIMLLKELSRYMRFISDDQVGALLIILALILALRRRTVEDRILLTWLAVSALAMMLLVSRRFELYLLPSVCIAVVLVGRGAVKLMETSEQWGRPVLVSVVAVLLIPLFLDGIAALGQEPLRVQNGIREAVSCGRILAPNEYWFSFTDCDFRSFDQVSQYHHRHDLSLSEAMDEIRPDYLIVDEDVEAKLQEGFGAGGDMGSYYMLPEPAFERFLDERAGLVQSLSTDDYGAVRVYRINWVGE